MKIYYRSDKIEYVQHLLKVFHTKELALAALDEVLDFQEQLSSDWHDLLEVKKILNEYSEIPWVRADGVH